MDPIESYVGGSDGERGLHRGVSRKENKEESDNLEYRITKKDLGNWDNSLVIPICEIQYSIFVNYTASNSY